MDGHRLKREIIATQVTNSLVNRMGSSFALRMHEDTGATAAEVARAFTIPLKWLAESANYRTEERQHPDSQRPWPVIYYDLFDGEMLWGATARMTLSLIDVLRNNA